MQRKNILQFNKKILCILILFVIIYSLFSFMKQTQIVSYGATYTYTNSSNNLPSNFDQMYPGYRTLINTLAVNHPTWTFNLYETGLDWNTVVSNESRHGKNLVQVGYYTSDWGCSCNTAYDGASWKCASHAAVSYMMDPRHFLNEYDVFQFQELNSSNGDEAAVRSMISGTFMDTDANREDVVKGIMSAATTYNINPYFITSKIIQEQSNSGSVLSLGQGYDVNDDGINEYVGVYNLFNIGAYPTSDAGTIENGLKYAQNKGWTTMYKAILEGPQFLKDDYIAKGQSTTYFQKFNVVDTSNLYGHQYMTNVWGAYAEGRIMRSKYIKYGIYNNQFVFTIPLYNNMPQMDGELVYVNVEGTLTLRNSPGGSFLLNIDAGRIILRTEKAANKTGAYYYDKVITPYGQGYMARENEGVKTYLVPLNLIEPNDNNNVNTGSNNNFSEPDANNIILTEPNTTVNKIKEKYTNSVIVNSEGTEITGDALVGTGAKIKIDGVEKYTIVKLGDVSGDGIVKSKDYMMIKNYIMSGYQLTEAQKKAADTSKDGEIKSKDYMIIKNHIMDGSDIKL